MQTNITVIVFLVLTESSSGYAPYQAKSALKALNSGQRRELDFDTSSEEQAGTGSPSPPLHSTGTPSSTSSPVHQHTSLSSQDSRASSGAKISPPPANGVQYCLERAKAAATAAATSTTSAQHHRAEPNVGLDPTPPALPPKTRKAKVSEAPKVSEHSDWGDSDMDEETYSSSQEKLKVKKVHPLCLWIHWCEWIISFYTSSTVYSADLWIKTHKNLFFLNPRGANINQLVLMEQDKNGSSTNKHYTLPFRCLEQLTICCI